MKSVFISSTFRDMQIERDALHTRVFPLLNEQAAEYSEVFTGIDLRWGIQTSLLSEEEADKKAFLTCFDEIDSSRPYFIAFIGDRYGTTVSENSILRIFNLILNKDKMTKNEAKEFIKKTSITQKEIEYATFISKIAPSNCFFFFRKSYGKTLTESEKEFWIENDKKSKDKLDKLKKQIKEKYPNSFYEYSLGYSEEKGFFLPEDEIKHFKDRLCEAFLKKYKKKKYSYHDALKEQMSFFSRERDFGFFGRKKDYDVLEKFLKNKEENILVLKGQSGLGKTSLISHLIEKEKNSYIFLPIFIGTTPAFMNESGILKYLHESLAEIKGENPNNSSDFVINDEADYRNVPPEVIRSNGIKSLLSKPIGEKDKPIVVVLDSLNTIHGSAYLDNLDFIPISGLGYGIKIIVSTIDDSSLNLFRCAPSGLIEYELKPLKKADIKTISNNVLNKVFHKESSLKMIENIVKKKNSFEPLYLSLLLRRLLLVNRYDFDNIYQDTTSEDARYNYLEKLIHDEADLSEELATSLFKKVIEFSGAKFLSTAFSYIALSPYGLTVQDLEELIPNFDESDFYIAIRFLAPLFYRDEQGRISFSHERIKISVQNDNKLKNEEATKHLLKFFKKKGENRYNERVSLIFNGYSYNKSLIQDLLKDEKDEDISPLVLSNLFSKLVEELEKGKEGESVIYDCLFENHHYSLLSRLLKRIIDESRLETLDYKLVAHLCDQSPVNEEDLSDKTSAALCLRSLLLMILKANNIHIDSFKNSIGLIPYGVFKSELEVETFPEMFSLFIVCCFKYFGISSYEEEFVTCFIQVNETLGYDYAIYHLSAKELLLLDEPENSDRTIKLENLLGEATFIKGNKSNSAALERFINRISLTYFLNYSKGHDAYAAFDLASDILVNTNYLLYVETSYEYQKGIAKVLYVNAEAAHIGIHENDSKFASGAYVFSKNAFLLSSYLATRFFDEDMVELSIDSLQLYLNATSPAGIPLIPGSLEKVNSLVEGLSKSNKVSPVIKAKLLMIQGFVSIDNKEYEEAQKLYRLAISYLKDTDIFHTTLKAYTELSYSIAVMLKGHEEETEYQDKTEALFSELVGFMVSSFEKGLYISHYDCEEIRIMIKDFYDLTEISDETYENIKLWCYLSYCSYYQTNQPMFIRDAGRFYPMILNYFNKRPDLKEESSRFFNTLKKYDPYDLVKLSFTGISQENIEQIKSLFDDIINKQPFEAFKILTVLDRVGTYCEQIGELEGAAAFYGDCWNLNRKLLQEYKHCFGFYKEILISIEAYNRVVAKINGYPDAQLCMHYLVNFANLLSVTPFRNQKLPAEKEKSQIEQALSICIAHKEFYEHLGDVIDRMDEYYSNAMNFPNRLEYERQYALYSYYRVLFGCLTDNQKHISKGCSDMWQCFSIIFYYRINDLRDCMDEAELAALVTFSTMFRFQGPKEMAEAYYNLSKLYPDALESHAVARIRFE